MGDTYTASDQAPTVPLHFWVLVASGRLWSPLVGSGRLWSDLVASGHLEVGCFGLKKSPSGSIIKSGPICMPCASNLLIVGHSEVISNALDLVQTF